MKTSLFWLFKTINYLEIGILTSLSIVITIESVTARPACYLIDATGREISLGHICKKKVTPEKNKTQTPSPQPQNNTQQPQAPSTSENNDSGNPPQTTPETNQTEKQEEEKPEITKETNPELFSPAQRTIPLLETQREETVPEQ